MGVGMKGDTRRGQSEKEWWNNHEVDVWSVRGVLSRNGSAEQEWSLMSRGFVCWMCGTVDNCGSQRRGYHGKWVFSNFNALPEKISGQKGARTSSRLSEIDLPTQR